MNNPTKSLWFWVALGHLIIAAAWLYLIQLTT